ncbi:type II toxin-antitoxin system Phd/YefM family antitoxin [Falsiroseomonas sp.]|jgi:antitoxin (DNA-binding transcriptional repressor) of toxin-antitoxin stability system|uniref:type II toxin-antitoxin system Phd/YefM family antitoxin n=1 Tax=Falsiroseomonas sp. TaxID=2870721 RepID=UPI003F70801D
MPSPGPGSPQRVGVRELRDNLTTFLREARQGSAFLVTSHDRVVAELRPPPQEAAPPRQPGVLAGRIRLAPDFDETPPDLIDSMEAPLG